MSVEEILRQVRERRQKRLAALGAGRPAATPEPVGFGELGRALLTPVPPAPPPPSPLPPGAGLAPLVSSPTPPPLGMGGLRALESAAAPRPLTPQEQLRRRMSEGRIGEMTTVPPPPALPDPSAVISAGRGMQLAATPQPARVTAPRAAPDAGAAPSVGDQIRLAARIGSHEILPEELPEEIPWQQLLGQPGFTEVAAIGLQDPQRGRELLVQRMAELQGRAPVQFGRGLTAGSREAVGLEPGPVADTAASRAGQFTGRTGTGLLAIAGAAGTGGATATGLAGRLIPGALQATRAGKTALTLARGIGTGAALAGTREAVGALETGEVKPGALGRIGTEAAFFGLLDTLMPTVGGAVGQRVRKALPGSIRDTALGRALAGGAGGTVAGGTAAVALESAVALLNPADDDEWEILGRVLNTAVTMGLFGAVHGAIGPAPGQKAAGPFVPPKVQGDVIGKRIFVGLPQAELAAARQAKGDLSKLGYQEWRPGSGVWQKRDAAGQLAGEVHEHVIVAGRQVPKVVSQRYQRMAQEQPAAQAPAPEPAGPAKPVQPAGALPGAAGATTTTPAIPVGARVTTPDGPGVVVRTGPGGVLVQRGKGKKVYPPEQLQAAQSTAPAQPEAAAPAPAAQPTMDRAQALRDALPGVDERAVQDMAKTTSNLSDEEFTQFVQRQAKTEGPTAPEAPALRSLKLRKPLNELTEAEIGKVEQRLQQMKTRLEQQAQEPQQGKAVLPIQLQGLQQDLDTLAALRQQAPATAGQPASPAVQEPPRGVGQGVSTPEAAETPTAAPEAKAAPAKEAWQMTTAEMLASDLPHMRYGVSLYGTGKMAKAQLANAERRAVAAHKKDVALALSEGKLVPPEVLADYPDLKKAPAPSAAGEPAQGRTEQPVAPQEAPASSAAPTKETWRMTREEFAGPEPPKERRIQFGGSYREEYVDRGAAREWEYKSREHAFAVADALDAGKPVPEKVLADYPDLKRLADYRTAKSTEQAAEAAAVPASERLRQKVEEERGKGLTEEGGFVAVGGQKPGNRSKYAFENEEAEQRWQEAKGLKKPPLLQRIGPALVSLKNKLTREYEHLPRTKEHAQFRFFLQQLGKGKGVASDKALRHIQGVTVKLDADQFDLFTRKVILDDLMEEVRTQREQGEGEIRLPFGFTPATLAREQARITTATEADALVKEALTDRKSLMDEIKAEYVRASEEAIGYTPPLNRKDYYRHQVIAYAELAGGPKGTGQKLKAPTKRGFLRSRVGSELDINTEYLQAEYEWMSQVLYDTKVYQVLKFVRDHYDRAPDLRRLAKEQGLKLRDVIPEGYTEWSPQEGGVFYRAWSVPEKFIQAAIMDAAETMEIATDQLRKVLVVGGNRQTIIIPTEVAETLNHFGRDPERNSVRDAMRVGLTAWKKWQLLSPRRVLKYNLRNLSGDIDATLAGNPRGLLKAPQAIRELYQFLAAGSAPSKELESWMERGGMQDVLQVAENMGDIKGLTLFWNLDEGQKGTITAANLAKRLLRMPRKFTDFREAVLRYANYLSYLEHMQKHDGRPQNYGASIREEVEALPDVQNRAFKLANDLLGNYDEITVIGQGVRERWIPFWSWTEVNARRYTRLLRNAVQDGQAMTTIGRTVGAKLVGTAIRSPIIAYRLGKLFVLASAFAGLTQAWNMMFFADEEDELPAEVKRRPHIIFGRDKDGKIIYFNRLGALHDFLEWFGLADAPEYVREYLNGRKTLGEIARDVALSDVNKLYQSLGPGSSVIDLLTGQARYPDVRRPRAIRDRWEFLADELGLGAEYREFAGRPTRGYASSLKGLAVYELDPGEAAYYDALSLKSRFMREELGRPGGVFEPSPKSNALYWYKQALRYGDKEAAQRYLLEYARYGGTKKGLKQSLESLDPLSGLSKADKKAFVEWLTVEDKKRLKRGYDWYKQVLAP